MKNNKLLAIILLLIILTGKFSFTVFSDINDSNIQKAEYVMNLYKNNNNVVKSSDVIKVILEIEDEDVKDKLISELSILIKRKDKRRILILILIVGIFLIPQIIIIFREKLIIKKYAYEFDNQIKKYKKESDFNEKK